MKNGEIWKESSKTYHLPWLSLVTGEFNVVHCYAEKVSTDEADAPQQRGQETRQVHVVLFEGHFLCCSGQIFVLHLKTDDL